ncbi:hypothetical protein [Pistricoccus aurantiacus]|uniref:hypothetical protein n=1 Tax=Pistricoccus aurantiacus TaxID=1883414 RepID=UPI003625CE68
MLGASPLAMADTGQLVYANADTVQVEVDERMLLGGNEVVSADGFTSGFRLLGAYLMPQIPSIELGAEISYLQSDDIPTSVNGSQAIMNTTSLNGALLAGLRIGMVGVFAKSGLAQWQGDFINDAGRDKDSLGGTAPIYGLGASMRFSGMLGQLEYEYIDTRELEHLRMATASITYQF